MRLAPKALLLCLLLAPAAAGAVEVVLGVETQTGYNSNVFATSEDPQQDGTVRFGPTIYLRDQTGQFTWNLNLRPSYEVYYTLKGINTFYSISDGDVSWRPSLETEFYASDSFVRSPVRNANVAALQNPNQAQTVIFSNNENVIHNIFTAGARHSFGPRWLGELSLANSLLAYQTSELSNSSALTTQASLLYSLVATDRVGGGAGWTQQSFKQSNGGSVSTQYYQLFGVWNHDFSPTMSLRVNAGPTLVVSPDTLQDTFPDTPLFARSFPVDGKPESFPIRPDTCQIVDGVVNMTSCNVYQLPLFRSPGVPVLTAGDLGLDGTDTLSLTGERPKAGGTDITYFANISLEKRWRWFTAQGSYVRSASNTSGFAQSVITDSFTVSGAWTPSALWRLQVTGLYTQFQSSSNAPQYFVVGEVVPGLVPCTIFNASTSCGSLPGAQATGVRAVVQSKSTSELSNYGVTAELTRFIGRASSVFARATYQNQTTTSKFEDAVFGGSSAQSLQFDQFIFTVGFRYEFDAFHL
jgi:hypothetical protein